MSTPYAVGVYDVTLKPKGLEYLDLKFLVPMPRVPVIRQYLQVRTIWDITTQKWRMLLQTEFDLVIPLLEEHRDALDRYHSATGMISQLEFDKKVNAGQFTGNLELPGITIVGRKL